jgi:hypothetical protein
MRIVPKDFLTLRSQLGVINRVDMNGYTKLFGSIIASTIWRESKETKIVWITMLAMANKHGIVEASVPGLADMARVSLPETETALQILSSPDSFSRTKDFEGRRIEVVDGGWVILNHAKYREKMSADERRQYNRLKQQEFRERQRRANPSTSCQQKSITVNHSQSLSAMSAQAETEADADANTEEVKKPKRSAAADPVDDDGWLKSLESDVAYYGIDVRRELAKMTAWCTANNRQPNRRRFINWLNRCDRPLRLPQLGDAESVKRTRS